MDKVSEHACFGGVQGYYRHASFPCWKRGDDLCPVRAPGGVQETAAIFGNDPCASAHPSSVAPVLGALGAVVHVVGPEGERDVPFPELWRPPTKGVASDVALGPADLIGAVSLRPGGATGYEEVRQKAAFDWPLVCAAVRYRVEGERIAGIVQPEIEVAGDETIDASGLVILPGAIDAHTHFIQDDPAVAEPNPEEFEGFVNGGRAAAAS